MPSKAEVIERRAAYSGFFKLEQVRLRHELFAGGSTPVLLREIVSRSDIVAVLPYDPERDRILLIEQFRVGACLAGQPAWLYETVAGMIEPGETAEAAAVREVREETGAELAGLERIGTYFLAPHQSPDRVHLFLGQIDSARARNFGGLANEGEDVRVAALPRQEAIAMALTDRVKSPWTLISLLWLRLRG
jgi:ADP-ribose pyrophosphatase